MDFNVVDWHQPKPSEASLADDWHSVSIRPLELDDPRLSNVVDLLRQSHVNGGAMLAQFALEAPASWFWFLSRNRLAEANFFRRFFEHSDVAAAFGNKSLPRCTSGELPFEMEASHVVTGRLSAILAAGGAYEKFKGSDRQLLAVVSEFTESAFELRYSDLATWYSFAPWSDWFMDVAWDSTFFWFDKAKGRVTCLLVTDTD